MKIDPSLRGQLPRVEPAVPWASPDGARKGWKLTLPGQRPLATPTVVGGRVFLGGGFGSYDFYALDADSGGVVWQYQTEDDGPTAAVAEDGFVVFNTESCELEVLTTEGRAVWKKWLGDPLMSMPAVAGGTVYQAFPDSRGDRRHYLGAFDLRTGAERWRRPISGEVITGPVAAEGHVYVTNLDGTLSCFRQEDGERVWQDQKNATTSPVVREGRCYFSQRREVKLPREGNPARQQMEHMAMRSAGAHGATSPYEGTACFADHLDHAKRAARSPHYAACEMADGMVGFGSHKGDAKMDQGMEHLGHGHVSSLWAYQGSKPFLWGGRLFGAVGDTLHCADPDSQEIFWKKRLYDRADQEEVLDNVLTPPAVVNGKLFVGTIRGEVCCLSAESGEVLWRAPVDEPVIFQPAVVGGRVYAPTWNGSLFCIATGDPGDDGWHMWGANAAHNGLVEEGQRV
jgi:Ca-activated chloride channel family protein